MFKIAFYLFDYTDGSFKKVYFHHWNDSNLFLQKTRGELRSILIKDQQTKI